MAAQNNIPVKDGGTWRASQPKTRVAGSWVAITNAWVNIAGMWTKFYQASSSLGVLITPGGSYTSRSGGGAVTSPNETATPSGGTPGYTYLWDRQSGDIFSIGGSTTATASFSTTLFFSQYKSGVYRCTVTDSLGATAFQDITIEFESF